MALPPVVCDKECHTKRLHLYLFYSGFLASLLLLALLHFIFFLSSRLKSKYEAKDYATRKLEFFSGVPDLSPTNEMESGNEKGSHAIEEDNQQIEPHRASAVTTPEPGSPSSSTLNGMQALNGVGSVSLQRIDEETTVPTRTTSSSNNRCSFSASSSSPTLQDRNVMGAVQEPVVVTVATVSALFQEHDPTVPRSRPQSTESMSSVIDISDLVSSPARSAPVRSEDARTRTVSEKNSRGWIAKNEHGGGLHTKHQNQMLEVRVGGGKGGFLKSHRGEHQIVGESLSTDAILPASDSEGVYNTDHVV